MDSNASSNSSALLPWPSLAVLAGATFVIVATELLPTAVLPAMGAELGVPTAQVGLLVSLWAAVVVVASFPLVRLTAAFNRRLTIAGGMAALGGATTATAFAESFATALGTRLVAAAACGLLWATINAHTAAIVPERRLARAVAVVLGGGTLGAVVAAPAANTVARLWDWRVAFIVAGVLGLLAALAVLLLVVPQASHVNPAKEAGSAPASTTSARNAVVLYPRSTDRLSLWSGVG